MKKIMIVFISLMTMNAYALIDYKISKVHGLIKFLDLLGENKKEYWELIPKDKEKEVGVLVNDFYKLKNRYFFSSFSLNKKNYKSGRQSINSLILWQSMNSVDIGDFNSRVTGLLTIKNQKKLTSILVEIEPFYTKFWNENKKHLYKFKKRTDRLIRENKKFKKSIQAIKKFYNAEWDDDLDFPVGIYLLPEGTKASGAQSFDQFEEASIVVNGDFNGRMGVIVHEMSHSFFANKDASKFQKLENFYNEHSDPFAKHAYTYLNEGLATAIGNGYVFNLLTGKVDKSWYNNVYIEGFAREMYPLVVDYIKNGKSLNDAFYQKSISSFKKRFPDINERFESLLNKPLVSTIGRLQKEEIEPILRDAFRTSGVNYSTPFTHPYTVEDYTDKSMPLILVVGDWSEKALTSVKKAYPSIYQDVKKIVKKDYVYFFKNNKFHLVVKYKDSKSFIRTVNKIVKQKKI
ncbi:hypothetical protein ACRXCV_10290 [Halobacteriovorax sp. GFR7]|uniref:hypothetical protein n=1 Tax=unclassified Halobacteriovorax TaxID=2639665 RepID=UPI003D999F78